MLSSMKNLGMSIFNEIRRASVILLALFVILLISSCSPETMQLCRVGISTEYSTRNLTASITDPIQSYTKYYRTIYRGKGKSYGDMSESTIFKKLDGNGILVSQGLWDIEILFSEKTDAKIDGSIGTNYAFIAASRNTYINLNTTSITVEIENTENYGTLNINSYVLSGLSVPSATVSLYKMNENNGIFDKVSDKLPITNNNNTEYFYSASHAPGIYYAVFHVYDTAELIFTDCIGFVIRSGLTTKISGSYTVSGVSSIVNPGGKESTENDIKNFDGEKFKDVIYTIDPSHDYVFVSKNNTFKKDLKNKFVTINMNGKNIINSDTSNQGQNDKTVKTRTYFDIGSGSVLNIINKADTSSPSVYGSSVVAPSRYQTDFTVNGGTLNIGTSVFIENNPGYSESNGNIAVKGAPATISSNKIPNGEYRHAAIDVTDKGGTINLIGGDYGVVLESGVRGISSDYNIKTATTNDDFNLTITMNNSSINVNGDSGISDYGIDIDGYGKNGKIVINISGKDPEQTCTIKTSGASGTAMGYGIRIANFIGETEIYIASNAIIQSSDGYAIYIDPTCTGKVTINNQSSNVKADSDGEYALYYNGITDLSKKLKIGTTTIQASN